jgi:hypothetical protein
VPVRRSFGEGGSDGMKCKKEANMTKQTQNIQPLLNWVDSLFYKLSTFGYELFLRYELFLQNEPKIIQIIIFRVFR